MPTPVAEGGYWYWRDQPIYYCQAGDPGGAPPLLLVHGFGASTEHWRKNIAELSAEFEVWAIDLLGFGRSAKPPWRYSGDLWQAQLRDFINSRLERPAVLVGNSLGGYAVLRAAAHHPETAAGVALLNSAGPFARNPETTLPTQANRPLKQFARDCVRSLLRQPWASYLLFCYLRRPAPIRRTLKRVYWDPSAVTEELVEAIRRPARDRSALRVFRSVFTAPPGDPLDELLPKLQCPLLALWGERDPWMDASERAAKFRQHCPPLSEAFVRAGHCPHDEAPQQVDAELRAWMRAAVLPAQQPA